MFNYPISYRELEGRKKTEIRDEDLGVIYRSIVFKVIDRNEIKNKNGAYIMKGKHLETGGKEEIPVK